MKIMIQRFVIPKTYSLLIIQWCLCHCPVDHVILAPSTLLTTAQETVGLPQNTMPKTISVSLNSHFHNGIADNKLSVVTMLHTIIIDIIKVNQLSVCKPTKQPAS